ncbi:MAG TPA: signal peptide protein, partial [Bacillota bacterium]|nr:signal peptide protein [Bacillota bacterium]
NIIADPDAIEDYQDRIQGYTTTGFDAKLVGKKNLGKDVGDYIRTTKSSDKIAISIKDIYPGYAQLFRTDIVNPGTLAAKLSKIKATIAGDTNAVKNMIGISLKVLREDGDEVFNLLPNENVFYVGGETFVRLSALDEYTVDGDTLLSIYPVNEEMDNDQWRMDLILGVAMDPDAEGVYTTGSIANYNKYNDDAKTQIKNASFTLDFGWDQFNAKPNV